MLHSEKALPDAITHNDEIARLILVELRGWRDEMAGRAPLAVPPVDLPLVELREPAPPPPLGGEALSATNRALDDLAALLPVEPPAPKGRKKAGA